MTTRTSASLGFALLLQACSMFPYDSHYLCEKTDDYGRCTSVQGAYADATVGTPQKTAVHTGDPSKTSAAAAPTSADPSAPEQGYRAAEYTALAQMLDAPVTPILAPAKVLRTLVLAYQADGSLYMPRYVFTVVSAPHFVFGRGAGRPAPGEPMLYPNGTPDADSNTDTGAPR
jgi:conjugal transfer pilus assembly protein TraV